MKTAVTAEHVTVTLLTKKVLHGISLTPPEGRVIGLLEPSGADFDRQNAAMSH
jgi:ABC-type multidrug transport system ATPase subunit